ncbi:MAG: hypothetical protein LBI18_01210 [Planctomycetaceae bacterium]|jgi:hypothetical protein|nr:hypothetical protein [Planctomycetaceae bacterium]
MRNLLESIESEVLRLERENAELRRIISEQAQIIYRIAQSRIFLTMYSTLKFRPVF